MSCEVVELRYSLNGVSDSQIQVMFRLIEAEGDQLIIRRISDSNFSLSSDDLILEGNFSPKFLSEISRAFSPPLSSKITINPTIQENLRYYSTFAWTNNESDLFVGITILPMYQTKQLVPFTSPTHFLNLLTSTRAGSDLKSMLTVKPKGLISINNNVANIVFPNHRIDFVRAWLEKMGTQEIDLNWVSGSTGEISEEIRTAIGSVNQDNMKYLEELLTKSASIPSADLNYMYRKVILTLES